MHGDTTDHDRKEEKTILNQYIIELVDLNYQSDLFEKIIYFVFERILNDEDKQYQIDIEDIIE